MNTARTQKRALLFGGSVIALAVVAAIVAFALTPGAPGAPAAIQRLGRFHILTLHVPIGIFLLALAAELLTFRRRWRRRGDVIVAFALPLLAFAAFAAAILGAFLAHGGEYPAKLLTRHRGLALTGLALASITTAAYPLRRRTGRMVHRALLLATAGALGGAAHFGGSLTHGSDFLFKPVPKHEAVTTAAEDDAGAAPTEPDAEAPLVDAGLDVAAPADAGAVIAQVDAGAAAALASVDAGAPKPNRRAAAQAVLNKRCGPCHTTKASGGLRVTDAAKLEQLGAVITPGNLGDSSIYQRLVLPKDHDDHMPPADKPQPTAGEIAAIRAWVLEAKH